VKAAGYIRVSTQEQADQGWNLAEDRKLIEERCEREGWKLEIFDDGARQGDDPDRPGLRALIDRLAGFDVVIMRSQDRISRDIGIWAVTSAALRAAHVRVETFTGTLDLESPAGEFMANVMASVGKFEKRQTGARVRQALAARAKAGLHTGGAAPYGYRWSDDKRLVVEPHEAEIVRRIFTDYCNGMGQRAIVRALNDAGLPKRNGGQWQQSAITKALARVEYTGQLEFKGEVLPGAHERIISDDVWDKAQAIKRSRDSRGGGRHPASDHLLVGGILRCPRCGSAMLPRKARAGVERERYVCRGRVEHGSGFCSQPSIRRELIDVPFLAHLLDGCIDIEAMRKRIEDRDSAAAADVRRVRDDAELELQRSDARLERVKRGWQDGVIDDAEYTAQRAELIAEREAASAAVDRARNHIDRLIEAGDAGDAETRLLDHLAALKHAASAQAGNAPDLNALRNVIGDMFESIRLVARDEGIALAFGDGPTSPSPRPRLPTAGEATGCCRSSAGRR
jgi:site-specific DNA recombinase